MWVHLSAFERCIHYGEALVHANEDRNVTRRNALIKRVRESMIPHMASRSLKVVMYSVMMQFFQSPWEVIQTLGQEFPPKETASSL